TAPFRLSRPCSVDMVPNEFMPPGGEAAEMVRVRGLVALAVVMLATTGFAPPAAPPDSTRDTVQAEGRGGQPVTDAPPWAVFVAADLPADGGLECSGALIAPTLVLTAGHCTRDPQTEAPLPPGAFVAVVGRGDLNGEAGFVAAVTNVAIHPQSSTESGDDDVALLTLDRAVDVTPLPLAPSDEFLEPTTALLYGYGLVDDATPSEVLRRTPSGAYTLGTCPAGAAPSLMCFDRNDPSVEILAGDSGSPWILTARGSAVLAGVHF